MVTFLEGYVRGKSFRLSEKDIHISFITARENVLDALNNIGLNKKRFELPSITAGGATAVASSEVKDCLF